MNIIEKIKKKLKITDKYPWLKFYPKDKREVEIPDMSLYEYIYKCNLGNENNIAINYFNHKITYKKMFYDIDLCARALRSQGVRKDDVVSICMANTPEAVIMLYAVSKIGAIANMIHPLSSETEIRDTLKETNSVLLLSINIAYSKINNIIKETNLYKAIIVSARDSMPNPLKTLYFLAEDRKIKIPKSNELYISWNDFLNKGKNYDRDVLVHRSKDDIAAILHSGGTTGTPKHILLSNGNINVVIPQAKIALPELNESDTFLSILPMFHCFGLVECLHFPISTGETVVLVPKFDATRFDKLLSKYNPTVIPGVPTLFEAMIKNKHMQKIDLSKVKYIVSGGDSLSKDKNKLVNRFLKEHNCRNHIIQGYGMTETSGGVIFGALGSDLPGSVGIPLPSNRIKIIDINTKEELPSGKTGEILISGPTVMQGYLNNEKETNEVIEEDDKGVRWVHTGDMGYLNEQGILFFVQRLKRMIITSGYNVYPSHIEEVLNDHPKIVTSCVIGLPDKYKIQVGKAFIVLKEGIEPSSKIEKEIKEYLNKTLAHYMIPKYYEFRKSLPKTLVGKVDYKELEKEDK